MRFVFTAQAAFSHLRPLVLPLADAARRRGHDVLVATSPELAPSLTEEGWPVLSLPNVESIETAMRRRIGDGGPPVGGTPARMFADGFVSVLGAPMARDLRDALADDPPDLVVRENTEYGGYVAAEAMGVPTATVDVGPLGMMDASVVVAAADALRAEFGLAPVADAWHASRTLGVATVPEQFYPEDRRLPSVRHVRPPVATSPLPLPAAVADLPADRPLVLATLGSNAPRIMGGVGALLDSVIAALGRLPVSAVVALGPGREPAEWTGARPDNVVLQSFAPQRELLGVADLFVTHAGFGGVREALEAGVPMVALPMMAEQPANGARIVELGLGARLDPTTATTDDVADAVSGVLADDGVRARSRAMQRRMLALPSFDTAVEHLEAAAGRAVRA